MKKDTVRIRNRAANYFFDLADTPGISKTLRDRLRKIGDQIVNYRVNVLSEAAGEDLCWLGESIRDFLEPENLRIMDNFAAEVQIVLTRQENTQEGGKIMGLLDKLRGKDQRKNEQEDEETKKAKKNIFLARQLVEKNIGIIDQENQKITDILKQAAEETKESPRYILLQNEWQLSKDRIKSCGTKLTLAFNTLKINSKMVDAIDIFETAKLVEKMLPESKKVEKLMDKAMDKTEDLADLQDDLSALLEDALDEMNGVISAQTSDSAFGKAVSGQSAAVQTAVPGAVPAAQEAGTEAAPPAPKATDEQIEQFLTEEE